ncbi:MAG: histidine phosphatase family protein [Oscillospiraceae bacterium]|jgi:probable phosphoglycerate mutase|nr:histidine phosphatase family protein [Oscillospiraceae bacterium]
MTKIYLIRHAEAEGNVTRRVHGHYDSLVTPRGLAQIRELEGRLSALPIDAVYSSDLYRARKTAQAAYRPHGLSLHTDERLREVNMGAWEDLTFAEIARREPEQWNYLDRDFFNWRVTGAETPDDAAERFADAMREIARIQDGRTVAVFAHAFVIQLFLCRILGVTDASAVTAAIHPENTAVAELTYSGGEFALEKLPDAPHLSPENSTARRSREARLRLGGESPDLRYIQRERYIWTAQAANNLAGIITLDPETGADEGYGLITRYELSPEFRGKLLGIQPLGTAISVYRALGRDRLRIVLPDAAADAGGFFEHIGFAALPDAPGTLEYNISIAVANRDF